MVNEKETKSTEYVETNIRIFQIYFLLVFFLYLKLVGKVKYICVARSYAANRIMSYNRKPVLVCLLSISTCLRVCIFT